MARYTGPRVRISRRFGLPIFGPTKYLERRAYGPGVHGPKSRRKTTEYGLGLIEKQNPVMGERHFAGFRNGSSSDQTSLGNGVVGSPERSSSHHRVASFELSCHTINAAGFQCFLRPEWREDGR